jgi:hypothetical protein
VCWPPRLSEDPFVEMALRPIGASGDIYNWGSIHREALTDRQEWRYGL